MPAHLIFSIPTGVELSEFAPQEKSRELLAQVQIPADAFIFGSVAVLRSWKGHLDLLEAFHKASLEEGARAFPLLVGEGPYRVVIEEKIAQLGVGHWVRLAGFRDQVAPWFALRPPTACWAVVLILHDASQPPITLEHDWKPKGLCKAP